MDNTEENKAQEGSVKKYLSILIVFSLAALAFFSFYKTDEKKIESKDKTPPSEIKYFEAIAFTKEYDSGIHTYSGLIDLPTPCHRIDADALVLESYPEQVRIRIRIKDEGGICAQVVTQKKFIVSFQASSEAVVTATINDEPVELLLKDALPEEKINNQQILE